MISELNVRDCLDLSIMTEISFESLMKGVCFAALIEIKAVKTVNDYLTFKCWKHLISVINNISIMNIVFRNVYTVQDPAHFQSRPQVS